MITKFSTIVVTLSTLMLFFGCTTTPQPPSKTNHENDTANKSIVIRWEYGEEYPNSKEDITFYVNESNVGKGDEGRDMLLSKMKQLSIGAKVIIGQSKTSSNLPRGMGNQAFDPCPPGAEDDYYELMKNKKLIILIQ